MKFHPDAVVVMNRLAQLDGSKLCRQIRHLFNLPFILLSDKSEREVYLPILETGAGRDYYMRLPINYEVLAARIRVLLWPCRKGLICHIEMIRRSRRKRVMPGAIVIASKFLFLI